jgi:hypothetical protein
MKTILPIIFLALTFSSRAQTKVEQTIPLKAGQSLTLNFDYPTVKIQTWDKPDVLITGTVSINKGENDQAFQLEISSSTGEVTVTSVLKDKENIPKRIVIKKDGREYYFRTGDFHNSEVQKFLAENGQDYSYSSQGVIQEINLLIYVPCNVNTQVNSKYGIVEVAAFDGPLTVESKYGGVDATIASPAAVQLIARTQYGEILTDLDSKFSQAPATGKSGKHWTEITSNTGKGPALTFESKYGNVYLRKIK